MRLAGPVLLLVAPLLLAGELLQGEAFLQRGMPRLAAQSFRAALADDPGSASARAGLGRALALQGRYVEALPLLQAVRGSAVWGHRLAFAEGECLARLGRATEAEAAIEEALLLDPQFAMAWYGLAMLRFEVGDHDGADRAVEALEALEPGPDMAAIARAWFALESGRDDVDVHLIELGGSLSPNGEVVLRLIGGIAAMDVDDPVAAARVLSAPERASVDHVRTAAYLSEALRRQGLASDALNHLSRPAIARSDAPVVGFMRARALVDLGEIEAAGALLAPFADSDDPEALASRWYVARAAGGPAHEVIAGQWRARVRAPGRTLAQLVPIVASGGGE